MVTDLCCHLTFDLRGAWHTVYAMLSRIESDMLPEIHTSQKFNFLKSLIHSQRNYFFVFSTKVQLCNKNCWSYYKTHKDGHAKFHFGHFLEFNDNSTGK